MRSLGDGQGGRTFAAGGPGYSKGGNAIADLLTRWLADWFVTARKCSSL
jgi:hypothetical protein